PLVAANRRLAATAFLREVQNLHTQMTNMGAAAALPGLWPPKIAGLLVRPDDSAGRRIAVFARFSLIGHAPPGPDPLTFTDDAGTFALALPATLPQAVSLTLEFRSSSDSETRVFQRADLVASGGILGRVKLTKQLEPVAPSIIAELQVVAGDTTLPQPPP